VRQKCLRVRQFKCSSTYAKVSKNVSVSAYQRLDLGLVSDPKLNVSISWKVGRSRSRLWLKVKRLVSVSDINVSFTSLAHILLIFAALWICLTSHSSGHFRLHEALTV